MEEAVASKIIESKGSRLGCFAGSNSRRLSDRSSGYPEVSLFGSFVKDIDSSRVSSSSRKLKGFQESRASPLIWCVDCCSVWLLVTGIWTSLSSALFASTTSWLNSFSWNFVLLPNRPVSAYLKPRTVLASARSARALPSKPWYVCIAARSMRNSALASLPPIPSLSSSDAKSWWITFWREGAISLSSFWCQKFTRTRKSNWSKVPALVTSGWFKRNLASPKSSACGVNLYTASPSTVRLATIWAWILISWVSHSPTCFGIIVAAGDHDNGGPVTLDWRKACNAAQPMRNRSYLAASACGDSSRVSTRERRNCSHVTPVGWGELAWAWSFPPSNVCAVDDVRILWKSPFWKYSFIGLFIGLDRKILRWLR